MTQVTDCSIVEYWESLQAVETEWRRLETASKSTVFQTWDWCECWLSHRRKFSPFILTARAGDSVHTLLPLCRSDSWRGLPIRRLSLIGSGPSDYGGWLQTGDPEPRLSGIAEAIRSRAIDLIDLHQLDADQARAISEALEAEYNILVLPQEPTLVVRTNADHEAYLSAVSKKFRKNNAYAHRRLSREFRYEEKFDFSEAELEGAMDVFFDLHQQRWLKKRLPGLFLGQGNRRFHKEVARRLARSGRLALALAFIDDKPAAAFYGFKFGSDYSYYLGGFDPEWSKYSVSSVLINNLIQRSCKEGFQNFDFLRGRESYKSRWLAGELELFRVVAYSPTLLGRLGAALARIDNQIVQRARSRLHE